MQKDHLKCPACGSMNPPDVDRCEICGSLLDIEEEEKQVLDNLKKIPDIGRKRAERVIISGVSRVKDLEEADRDDFASIERIGRATAEKIYRFLQEVKDERGKLKLCSECGSLMGAAKENCPKCDGGRGEKKEEDFEMRETLEEAEEKTTEETTEEKASKTCSVCGTSLEAGQDTCPVCGTSFAGEGTSQKEIRKEDKPDEKNVCDVCGTPMEEGMDRCPVCQSFQSQTPPQEGRGREEAVELEEGIETEDDIESREVIESEEVAEIEEDIELGEGIETEDDIESSEVIESEEVLETEEDIELGETGGSKEAVETEEAVRPKNAVEFEEAVGSKEVVETRKAVQSEEAVDSPSTVEWKKYEGYPGELDEDKVYIKSVLESIEHDLINTKDMRERFDLLSSYEGQGKSSKVSELSLELLLDVEELKELKEILSGLDEIKRRISTERGSFELNKKLEKIEQRCRDGEYGTAVDIAETLTEIPEQNEDKKLERKFKKRLMKVRGNLRAARETELDLKGVKDNLKRALEAGKSGEMEKGLQILDQGLTNLQKVLVFSSLLEGSKEELREIRKMGGETTEASRRLKEIKLMADEEDMIGAIKEINELFRELEEKKKKLEKKAS